MSKSPWIRFFPSDWLSATRRMSAAETGVYITLVMSMYEDQAPLRDDEDRLARLCGLRPSEFRRIRTMLVEDGKIVVTDAGLWNDRVEKELGIRLEKSRGARASIEKRWAKNDDETKADGYGRIAPPIRNRYLPEARSQKEKRSSSQQQPGGESERRARAGADPDRSVAERADLATTGTDPAGDDGSTRPEPATTGADPAGDRGVIEARLRAAAGLVASRAVWVGRIEPILGLIDDGLDLDRDILPAIRAKAATMGGPAHSWRFFVPVCRQAVADRAAGRAGWESGAAAVPNLDLDRARAAVDRVRREETCDDR